MNRTGSILAGNRRNSKCPYYRQTGKNSRSGILASRRESCDDFVRCLVTVSVGLAMAATYSDNASARTHKEHPYRLLKAPSEHLSSLPEPRGSQSGSQPTRRTVARRYEKHPWISNSCQPATCQAKFYGTPVSSRFITSLVTSKTRHLPYIHCKL